MCRLDAVELFSCEYFNQKNKKKILKIKIKKNRY